MKNFDQLKETIQTNVGNKNLTKRKSLTSKFKFISKLNSIEYKTKKKADLLRYSAMNNDIDCREMNSSKEDYSKSESNEQESNPNIIPQNSPLLQSNNLTKLLNRKTRGQYATYTKKETIEKVEQKRVILDHNDVYNKFYRPNMCYEWANNDPKMFQTENSSMKESWVDCVDPKLRGRLTRFEEESS